MNDNDEYFTITQLHRNDLTQFFSASEIALFDDGDMADIASKMADAYLDNVYWIDLHIIATNVLASKKAAPPAAG